MEPIYEMGKPFPVAYVQGYEDGYVTREQLLKEIEQIADELVLGEGTASDHIMSELRSNMEEMKEKLDEDHG